MACCGKRWAIRARMAFSASRSASVTTVPSDFSSVATWRKRGTISASATPASSRAKESSSVVMPVSYRHVGVRVSRRSAPSLELVEGGPEHRQHGQILWPARPLLGFDERRQAQDADDQAPGEIQLDRPPEQLLVAQAVADGSQAVEISVCGLEELVPRTDQMRFPRAQPPRVMAIHGFQIGQHPQQPGHVLRSPAMNHVEVERGERRSLKDGCRHAHHDELDFAGGQNAEKLV